MTTDAQTEANRQNAQHSTGPKTPEGKARSARNALRHGFRAKIILDRGHEFPNGEPEAFADLLESLYAELRPRGPREDLCVETYAVAHWRLQFILLEEIDSYVFCKPGSDNPAIFEPRDSVRLNALVRYEAHLDRQASRAMKDLRQLQLDRIYGGPEGAPRCNPAAEKCAVVRQIHADDKAREKAMRELEAMRRSYNPPPFNPDDFTSNELNPRPTCAAPPSIEDSAPNEPNSCSPRAAGSECAQPHLAAAGAVSTASQVSVGSSLPNEPNSRPSFPLTLKPAPAQSGGKGPLVKSVPPNEHNLTAVVPAKAPHPGATAGSRHGTLGFLAICQPNPRPNKPNSSRRRHRRGVRAGRLGAPGRGFKRTAWR